MKRHTKSRTIVKPRISGFNIPRIVVDNFVRSTSTRKPTSLMIAKAAIFLDGAVHTVERPGRHHDIIRELAEAGFKTPIGGVQGFVTSKGVFVDRKEALTIALDSKQVTIDKCHAPKTGLFSEDLW